MCRGGVGGLGCRGGNYTLGLATEGEVEAVYVGGGGDGWGGGADSTYTDGWTW